MGKSVFYLSAFIILSLVSCDDEQKDPPETPYREKIQTEIGRQIEQLVKNNEAPNLDFMKEIYWNSPDFLAVSNGNFKNYREFIEGEKVYFETLKNQKFTESDVRYTFLTSDMIIATYKGKAFARFKDEKQMRIDPFVATVVFQKINDSWKIIYTNESVEFKPLVAEAEFSE